MSEERDLNIVVVCLDTKYGEKIAKLLAKAFDMFFLDSVALYEFDIQPYTLSYVLKKFGEEYFRSQQEGTIKYVSTFSNTVITVDSGAILYQKNIDTLTKDGLIVYVKNSTDKLYKFLCSYDYRSREEYNFYCLNKRELIARDEVLSMVAEVVVDANYIKEEDCVGLIINEIQKYYGVK